MGRAAAIGPAELPSDENVLTCVGNGLKELSVRDLKLPDERHPEKAHRPDNAQPKKPDWIRVKAPTSEGYKRTRDILREKKLVTVCEEAGCPNVGKCWSQGHATMMIMGEICTRGCTFCNVATGKPQVLDAFEPGRVAHAVAELGLAHPTPLWQWSPLAQMCSTTTSKLFPAFIMRSGPVRVTSIRCGSCSG